MRLDRRGRQLAVVELLRVPRCARLARHVAPVAAPAPAQQVVEGRLVGLPHRVRRRRSHAPLTHSKQSVGRVAHKDDARVSVDELVEAAVVLDVLVWVEAIARREDVGVREVLEPSHRAGHERHRILWRAAP
eukprot:7232326-Prymnesium_polylepis.3